MWRHINLWDNPISEEMGQYTNKVTHNYGESMDIFILALRLVDMLQF